MAHAAEPQLAGWPCWRGPRGNGHVDWLPQSLRPEPQICWQIPLAHAGLGGIAANSQYVVLGDRDLDDFQDLFRCHDAATGELRWEVQRLAIGALDYGNSPRATPTMIGDQVICSGAMGSLICIGLADGEVLWERNLRDDFGPVGELPWGYCGSPLFVDGKIIVSPGGEAASLVALNPKDGSVIWKTAGVEPGYGSLTAGVLGGRLQIVGHDAVSLGGWDVATGQRLWTVNPDLPGDFNVPTPILYQGGLLVVTENNGLRRYAFDADGQIIPTPEAVFARLHPDMSTPVVVGRHLYCAKKFLHCIDLDAGISEQWRKRDRAIGDYAAIIASADRLLVVGEGELLLLATDGEDQIVARQQIFDQRQPIYSHPAIVGNRLYIRGESKLLCLELE